MFLRELLFTPFCIGCKSLGQYLCNFCAGKLKYQESSTFPLINKVICADDYHGFLRDRVIEYKSGNYELAEGLARVLMSTSLNRFPILPIVTVPSSSEKIKSRQIDAMAYLADRIHALNPKFQIKQILELVKPVKEQVGLSEVDRKINLNGAFRSKFSYSGDIILLDDVITTGATISAAAFALRKSGVTKIFVAGLCLSNKLH